MVHISEGNASKLIDLLLKEPAKKLSEPVALTVKEEIVGRVIVKLFSDRNTLDEWPAKQLGFYSMNTMVIHLINYAGEPIETLPDEKLKAAITGLEIYTGIKICR